MRNVSEERFWSKIDVRGPCECWMWRAGTNGNGYGHILWGEKRELAHRVSYSLANGPIPGGLHVLHKCDTPLCVNPAHLFVGTHTDNMRDKVDKGRGTKGESVPQSKLTEEDVTNIRSMYTTGEFSQRKLGAIFKIDQSEISNIVARKVWRCIL